MYVHKYYERYSLGKEKQFIDENLSCTYVLEKREKKRKQKKSCSSRQSVGGKPVKMTMSYRSSHFLVEEALHAICRTQ